MSQHLEAPELSVLICTRNRPEKLKRAVASVLANSTPRFELIVVDQSTDDLSAQAMAAFDDNRLRYLRTSTTGLSISRNIAIRAARADTVVFTDDDCVCDPGWLAAIQAEFAADPTAIAVYGRVVPYGRQGESSTSINVADDLICPAVCESTRRTVFDTPAIPHLTVGGGNNMSFRKEAFRRVGLFVETLGAGSPIGARMMKVAVRVDAAIFSSYALRFDRTAFVHVLRTGWRLAQDRLAIGSTFTGLMYFVMGLALAPKYSLLKPPRLEAA
jgi:glycosyltransferase involved in cell wall biosynthesis